MDSDRKDEELIDPQDWILIPKKEVTKYRDTIDWMRQTIHRAYHEGPLEDCRHHTCDAALRVLGERL